MPFLFPTNTSIHTESFPLCSDWTVWANTESSKTEDKVLVGLGLYDNSSGIPSTPELSNSRHPSTTSYHSTTLSSGKGLKLEETWEPQSKPLTLEDTNKSPVSNDAQLSDFGFLDPECFQYMNEAITDPTLLNDGMYWDVPYKPIIAQPGDYDENGQQFVWPDKANYNYNPQWLR